MLSNDDLQRISEIVRQLQPQLDQMQRAFRQLAAQVRVPQLLISDEIWRRLQAPIPTLNIELLQRMTLPAPKLIEDAFRSFAPTLEAITQAQVFTRQWVELFNRLSTPPAEIFGPVLAVVRRIGEAENVATAFQDYGLWLAPSMPEELVRKVVSLRAKGVPKRVAVSMLSRYYANENWAMLEKATASWMQNPYLAEWQDTIVHALDAHRRGQYTLTVPALLILVEGVCADYVKAKNLSVNLGGRTREVVISALKDTACTVSDVEAFFSVHSLLEYIENHMYISVNFDTEHSRLRREKSLLAHPIRHGRQRRYASRSN